MGRVVTSGNLGGVMVNVIVCTDLSGKEPQRQVDVDRVVTSGRLGGVNTLAQNARCVRSILAIGAIFPFLFTRTTSFAMIIIACLVSLLNLPCACIC